MLRKLAEFVVRRPKLVLVTVMVLLGVSGVFGSAVVDKLLVGGNNDPASESSQVDDFLNQEFPDGPNLIIQVIPHNGSLDGADVKNVTDSCARPSKPSRVRRSPRRSRIPLPPNCAARRASRFPD